MAELRLEIEDGIAVVTMDNPPVNAASQDWDFQAVFDSFYYNKDVRVAVLTGEGTRSFCAGADVKRRAADVGEAQQSGGAGGNTAYIAGQRRGRENFNCILESAVPVIGAINGYCLGAGMALAGSCDYLIASETASFGLPEINVGLLGGARHMMRAFPHHIVRRAHYSGERISAQDAYHFGAVWKLAPARPVDGRGDGGGAPDRLQDADRHPPRQGEPQRHRGVGRAQRLPLGADADPHPAGVRGRPRGEEGLR